MATKLRYKTLIFLTVILSAGIFSAHGETLPLRIVRHIAMATDFEAVLYGDTEDTDPESLIDAARMGFEAVDMLENRISSWKKDSFTSLLNRTAWERPIHVPGDVMELINLSQKYHERSQGVFDVTVGPLIDFWRASEAKGVFPQSREVKQVLEKVGLQHVVIDRSAQTVFFTRKGMRLDFGGIAKGLALDRMAVVLAENGVTTARLSTGTSTILAMGAPPGDAGWTVDIRSPYNTDHNAHIATVTIRNESLSTSSDAVRYMSVDGTRYSHILDPRTGMPAIGMASVTVIAPTGVESDALSTAFFVLGVDAARAYCDAYPEVRAILLTDQCDVSEPIFLNFKKDVLKE